MNKNYTPDYEALELEVLESGIWGTIGPHSIEDAAALAAHVGASRGLLCHSADAAYESLLRAFGCAHGDGIVTPAVCSPSHVLVAACTGASPRFCAPSSIPSMPDPDALDALLSAEPETSRAERGLRAVVTDFPTELTDTDAYPLDRLAAVCRAHGLPLILDCGGVLSARWQGRPLTEFADAVVWSLGEGSEICAGMGGLVCTESVDVINGAFAYHNCGRGMGEGCSLNFDEIVGGDFRVTEWTAAAAGLALRLGDVHAASPRELCDMTDIPLYHTDDYRRMTGL